MFSYDGKINDESKVDPGDNRASRYSIGDLFKEDHY